MIERLLFGRISLAFLHVEDICIFGLVNEFEVPIKRARLSEPISTYLALEEPEVCMSHVVVNHRRALRE